MMMTEEAIKNNTPLPLHYYYSKNERERDNPDILISSLSGRLLKHPKPFSHSKRDLSFFLPPPASKIKEQNLHKGGKKSIKPEQQCSSTVYTENTPQVIVPSP